MTEDVAVPDKTGLLRCSACGGQVIVALFETHRRYFPFTQDKAGTWTAAEEPVVLEDKGMAFFICSTCNRPMGEPPLHVLQALVKVNRT